MTKKKNMRNEFEFMSAVLDALGVDYEEADIKVRERWRGKVLDGWGVSYIPDDLKQFERWRKKCIEGLSKNSGGGGGGDDCPMKMATVTIQASTYRVRNVYFSGIENVMPLTNISDVKINITNGLANVDDDWRVYSEDATNGSIQVGETVTLSVLLVKGTSVLIGGGDGIESVTGEATAVNGVAVVTGDCTVVIRGTLQ